MLKLHLDMRHVDEHLVALSEKEPCVVNRKTPVDNPFAYLFMSNNFQISTVLRIPAHADPIYSNCLLTSGPRALLLLLDFLLGSWVLEIL